MYVCTKIRDMKKVKKRKWKLKKEFVYFLIGLGICIFIVVILIISNVVRSNKEQIEATPSATTEVYDASKGVIDEKEYDGTVLAKTSDAGRDYIDSTLFLGDSNTARFLTFTDTDGKTFTTKENSIGVVGMGIDAISTMPVIDFSTGRFTMVEAVKILQPQRIIITFGTNNLSGSSTDATSFIERYTKQIKAIEEAYSYADIIVNAIPPVSEKRDYPNVTMTQIDAYNKAIVKMCETNGWKFLNSSEVLKDSTTGYAASGMMDHDGLHLSKQGLTTLFKYIREHSYITEDTRPKPLNTIPTIIGVPSGLFTVNPLTNEEFNGDEATNTSCGENAWSDGSGGCYCNSGYTGDAYAGCVVEEKVEETEEPTATPTIESTSTPTAVPTTSPIVEPTVNPVVPSTEPTTDPTTEPTVSPSTEPTIVPSAEPTTIPTSDTETNEDESAETIDNTNGNGDTNE